MTSKIRFENQSSTLQAKELINTNSIEKSKFNSSSE
jgi:hypothetical protein